MQEILFKFLIAHQSACMGEKKHMRIARVEKMGKNEVPLSDFIR